MADEDGGRPIIFCSFSVLVGLRLPRAAWSLPLRSLRDRIVSPLPVYNPSAVLITKAAAAVATTGIDPSSPIIIAVADRTS